MKKVFLMSLLLIILMALASCGSEPSSIVFLTNRTDLKNTVLKDAATEFEAAFEDEGYKVRIETITDYESVVTTRLSGNNYGDVLLIPQTIETKYLETYFESFGTVDDLSNLGWKGISSKAYQNEVYGLPIGLTSAGMMINLDVFEQAGVNPATLTSPELFLQGMETIQAYGKSNVTDWKAAFHTQTATGWGLTQWAGGITTASGDFEYTNFELPWDRTAFWNESEDQSGQIGQLYELLYNLIVSNVVESSPTIDNWEESKIWFAQGKIASMAVGTWALNQFEGVAESIEAGLSDHIGYMPYPFTADDGEIYASVAADYTVGVAKNSRNQKIADAFATWLIEDFNYASKTGNIPPKEGSPYPDKIATFSESGVILVEERPATLDIEGALSLAEKNAASSQTDEKRIALWDQLWISDFAATAFDVRDDRASETVNQLLSNIQDKWNNGVDEVINEFGQKPVKEGQ